jgi:phosphoglycolate phosphatase-like HAD superfamily hydrolase
MIASIIFDFDGVIADSVNIKTDAFLDLYSEYPISIQKKVKEYHLEHSGISRYKKIYFFQKELVKSDYSEEIIDKLADSFKRIVLEKVIDSNYISGAYEFLDVFHQVIDLHIATGTPQDEIEFITKRKNISHFFKSIHGSPLSKSEIVGNIIKQYKYDKKDILFIGDAMADYIGAKDNSIKFLGRVEKGEHSIFPKEQAVINNLNNLEDYIGN